LTANETLANSELTKLNPNTTSKEEIKAAFCREVARTARIYAPPPGTYVRITYGSHTDRNRIARVHRKLSA
jgi:hypothetical protein